VCCVYNNTSRTARMRTRATGPRATGRGRARAAGPRATGPGGALFRCSRQLCAASTTHPELNAALQAVVCEQVQAFCYNGRGDLPGHMHVLVSTTSTAQVLRVYPHSSLMLIVPPPETAPTSARMQRQSVGFGTNRVLLVVVSGVTPIRDRVGRCTHRAVLHVRT